ncbi:MAG: uroporphyrinogen decarboxylase family protein [Promethearchaeati archaeon]
MDARERVLSAIEHKESDRIPSFELSIDNLSICKHFEEEYVFQGIVKSFQQTYKLCEGDPEALTKTILMATETRSYLKNTLNRHLSLYQKIGIDLSIVPFTGYILFPKNCFEDYFIDEYGRIFDLKRNPSDMMDIAYYKTGYFENFEDYENFERPNPKEARRETYFKAMKKTEKQYKGEVFVIPSMWGVFESTWQSFGFSTFSKLMRDPRKMENIFNERGNFALELAKTFIEWGEDGAILIYDDFGYKSGLLMNPKMLQKYVIPWIEKICQEAHKSGVKIILHSCGDVYEIFDDLVNTGIDAIHPIEPTTSNPKYDIFQLAKKYGERLTFIGNVSPQDLANKDTAYIKNYTSKLIKKLGPNGGYIMSSGHSINPAVKLENFLAMYETLEKEGVYPIN